MVSQQADIHFHHFVNALARIRAVTNHVPEAKNLVHPFGPNIGQNRLEGLNIAVDVANKRSFQGLGLTMAPRNTPHVPGHGAHGDLFRNVSAAVGKIPRCRARGKRGTAREHPPADHLSSPKTIVSLLFRKSRVKSRARLLIHPPTWSNSNPACVALVGLRFARRGPFQFFAAELPLNRPRKAIAKLARPVSSADDRALPLAGPPASVPAPLARPPPGSHPE